MSSSLKKQVVAAALDLSRVSQSLSRVHTRLAFPFIRAVNLHATPAASARNFEQQLKYYSDHYCPVSYGDLLALTRGEWDKPRPGLILCFDDGFRDQAEVAAPRLDEYGFIGWFFIPPGFIDTPPEQQMEFSRTNQFVPKFYDDADPRLAMTWTQVRELRRRHVIGCHGYNHRRLGPELGQDDLVHEIVGGKRRLEEMLDCEIKAFCWAGGEESSYSHEAARLISESDYEVSFISSSGVIQPHADLFQLQRTNVESDDDMSVVRFQLSGLLDLMHAGRRRRVRRCISDARAEAATNHPT